MKQYEIRCTPEQTKKALELGAPINVRCSYNGYHPLPFRAEIIIEPHHFAEVPTTEEMIGWLEEQEYISEVDIFHDFNWTFSIWDNALLRIDNNRVYISRKEATLAAIDAALDYLTNHKKAI